MQCPQCQHENPEGARFCNSCGAKLEAICPACNHVNPPGSRFCNACGHNLTIATPQPVQSETEQQSQPEPPPPEPPPPDAERRQLTVMFCDLEDSTKLSGQLDPEDLRDVIRAYQSTSAEVIERYDGYIAQHLGDGLMVYFGWPQAHEDDAQRAVYTGLGILEAMRGLNSRLEQEKEIRLAVRIGIHTGLVVVGEIGKGARQEHLALGETPNIASRIEGMAEPDTVAISDTTHQLVQGYFDCEDLGQHQLKGVDEPQHVYRVLGVSGAQTRLDVATARGLTSLVGREQEVGLLLDRWEQAQDGMGQVVLLSGEAGIGKSRLLQVMKDHVAGEPHVLWECRSSPYYQNTPLYPITDILQRTLRLQSGDTPERRLEKLEHELSSYTLPLQETVPLFAPLLSLAVPEDRYGSLNFSPQRQRQKMLETILAILLELSEQQPVIFILEDLHWTDPTTLELLDLLIEQTPTASILTLLTCRPAFQPSWKHRSYLTEVTVKRLSKRQIERMAERTAGGKKLPGDVLQQIVEKTDGVPLYVEEMTKAVLESGLLKDVNGQYEAAGSMSTLTIPATLQDSLMARLDRMVTAKAVAQYAAVIGRQFSYALLAAISQLDAAMLQHELGRLVEAEILYQRGQPPQATYVFKHALIQDTAYESLLKRTRQQYHQQIAQVLEQQFPEIVENQPELLAHHYTESGLTEMAIAYWHRAGDQATQRVANQEAIGHFDRALALLTALPDTPERIQHALTLYVALAERLEVTKGLGNSNVERAWTRAHELCQQIGDAPLLNQVLMGLFSVYINRAAFSQARELAEHLFSRAQRQNDPFLLLAAYRFLGTTLLEVGDIVSANTLFAQGNALYDLRLHPQQQLYDSVFHDFAARGRVYAARPLWLLGYADQALAKSQEALTLSREVARPYGLAFVLANVACTHQYRREVQAVREHAEEAMTLCREYGFAQYLVKSTFLHGWALAMGGQEAEGIAEIRLSIPELRAMGIEWFRPYALALLAEAYGQEDQHEAGLTVLDEALTHVDNTGQHGYEAELYHLRGELLLNAECRVRKAELSPEESFQKALSVARRQQAKSWELRAATSLARLWQSQGKRQEAYDLLQPVYGWFTEGFDTADLKDAKALLGELEQ